MAQGFRSHLADAIRLNTARRPIYMERTQGRSRSLSDDLIATERLCLPIAAYFDWRGRAFECEGIPVISGAFVAMDVPPAETPTRYTGRADAATLRAVARLLAGTGRRVREALWRSDFALVAAACEEALQTLADLEKESSSHFAMCKHLVESLGLGALNGRECQVRSGGKATGLARDLIAIQLLALGRGPDADRRAQEFHALGVGILVNDMPAIPFLERWRSGAWPH